MRIGDVVIAAGDYRLACGSGRYTHAICVGTDPLVLSSEQGDMLWHATLYAGCVVPLCQAHPDIVAVGIQRYERDIANGMAPRQNAVSETSP